MPTPPRSDVIHLTVDTPLHHSLSHLALSHDPSDDLLAEDLSLEDSFEATSSSQQRHAAIDDLSDSITARDWMGKSGIEDEENTVILHDPLGEERRTINADERVYSYTGTMGTLPPPVLSLPSSSSLHPSTSRPLASASTARSTEDNFEVDEEDLGLPEEVQLRRKALREERDSLRVMNGYLQDILSGLEVAEGKMLAFEGTIGTTHELLELYVRVCSQAEHTQQLLLDRSWHGVKDDIEVQKAIEALAAQELSDAREAMERAEEQARANERARVEAAEALSRKAVSTPSRRGVVTRGRPAPRGAPSIRGATTTSIPSASISSGISRGSGAGVTGVRGVRGLRSRVVGRGRGTSSAE